MTNISITSRILLTTAGIGAFMLSLAALALIGNAKNAIELEVNAGRSLARDYVIATVDSLLQTNTHEEVIRILPGTMFQPRHVTITISDTKSGQRFVPNTPHHSMPDEQAPQWFVRLLEPPPGEIRLPIESRAKEVGAVIIGNSAADEINEIWEDFFVLAIIGFLTYLATLLTLALVLKLAFSPLSRISKAFTLLEDGDFSTRIGHVSTPDFKPLAERFDSLADTVQQALADKDHLNRRLLETQDQERRAIGMELHDEFGPNLFGLRVESRAILDTAKAIDNVNLTNHAQNVLNIVERIQLTNRELLARLRPMEIGELPLSELLDGLVDRMKQLNLELDWQTNISNSFDEKLSEAEELNIYRIIQEACTNVLKHAMATTIKISLHATAQNQLDLTIVDNGSGWQGVRGGGINGLFERAESLGGTLSIENMQGNGTKIHVTLPYQSTTQTMP